MANTVKADIRSYDFTGFQKTLLFIGMGLGLLSLGITWLVDDELHTRFWSNFLHNSVFFIGISLMAAFFYTVCITAWAGWHTLFKRLWEAIASYIPVGFVFMLFIAISVFLHWNHLYHWSDPAAVEEDAILNHKSSFLNTQWYLWATVVSVGLWIFITRKLRSLSLAEDEDGDNEFNHHHKMRIWAAAFLPIAGFSSAALIWLWVMSVDAHWYSTLYAWYTGASWFVSMIATTILIIIFLKSKGYYNQISFDHIHDLGKFLFAFSIFWTYLWFSQFMLIWYANVGEETIYFRTRMDDYPVLFYGNLVINFVLPFFILMRNDTKRKLGSVGLVALLVLFGHWLDFFLMLKPGILHTAHEALHGHGGSHETHFAVGFTIPGFLEIGTFIGFLSLFLYLVFNALSKAAMVPSKDPYLAESIHHHV